MKVSVLTITSTNYGNRLQNYAVNHILQSLSLETENLVVYDFCAYDKNPIKKAIKRLLPISFLKGMTETIRKKRNAPEDVKEAFFEEFTEKYMNNKKLYVRSPKEFGKLAPKDNFVFVGSDQIWNPDFAGYDYFFGDFVAPEKRIAFSASIGYTKLPKNILERYTFLWNQMKYISVREDSAADMIEQAAGKRPDVFLDPTLLLTREEWNQVEEIPVRPNQARYVLCVFLGEAPEYIREVYGKIEDIEIVYLNQKEYLDYYLLNPGEFIWMIKHAQIVLTDSFHCAAFSIIFHQQFWVFERKDGELKDMFSRMETLLSKFGLTDRIQRRKEDEKFQWIEEERFVKADEIRRTERVRVTEILSEILKEETSEKPN